MNAGMSRARKTKTMAVPAKTGRMRGDSEERDWYNAKNPVG